MGRTFGIVWLVLGLALGVTSTAMDYWYWASTVETGAPVKPYIMYFGLWKVCERLLERSYCISWSDFKDADGNPLMNASVYLCQAMMVIGVVLNSGAAIWGIWAFIKNTSTKAVQGLAICAAVCYVLSAGVFAVKYHAGIQGVSTDGNLHVGLALAVCAAVVNLVAVTCLLCADSRRHMYRRIGSSSRGVDGDTIDDYS